MNKKYLNYVLSIIIPLYNEENSIIEVLEKLQAVSYPNFLKKYEIIVVNDDSTDKCNTPQYF